MPSEAIQAAFFVFGGGGRFLVYFETFAKASQTKSMISMEHGRFVRLVDLIKFLFRFVSKCGRAVRAP